MAHRQRGHSTNEGMGRRGDRRPAGIDLRTDLLCARGTPTHPLRSGQGFHVRHGVRTQERGRTRRQATPSRPKEVRSNG